MFVAMNRFKINPAFEADFEQLWRERGLIPRRSARLSLLRAAAGPCA